VVLRRDELASNRSVGAAQAAYYLATGVAPFAGRRAFEAVTGRKREWWLVLTVGAIVSVVGASLASAVANDRVTPEVRLLGVGSAASLGGIDVVYVLKGRIAPTYLVDAAVQAAILAAWVRAGRTET
jgi:hypothetical protein